MKKAILITLSALALGLLALVIGFHLFFSAERVSGYVSDALGDEFTVEIGSVSFGVLNRRVGFSKVNIQMEREGEQLDVLLAESISVNRLGLLSALGGSLQAGQLTIQQFYFDSSLIRSGPDEHLRDRDLPNIQLGQVTLEAGVIPFRVNGITGGLHGLDLNGYRFHYDPEGEVPSVYNWLEEVELSLEQADFNFWDDRYQAQLNSLIVSETDSSLHLGGATLKSRMSDTEFFETLGYQTDLFDITLDGFRMQDIHVGVLRAGEGLVARFAELDGLDLEVIQHNAYEKPEGYQPSPMPQVALMNLTYDFVIDSISVNDADIRYSEYPDNGDDSGTIHFASIQASVSTISNRSFSPIQFTATSLLEGDGRLDVDIMMLYDGPEPVVEVNGRLSNFDLTLLNPVLGPLEGIKIEEGRVEDLTFDYQMREFSSTGVTNTHYIGFQMTGVDEKRERWYDRLSQYLTNRFLIRSSSENSNGDYREGTIEQDRDMDRSFFHYLWASLRSGLMDTISRV